jgi:hypothetical protein
MGMWTSYWWRILYKSLSWIPWVLVLILRFWNSSVFIIIQFAFFSLP